MEATIEFTHAHNDGRITLFLSQIYGVLTMPEQKVTAILGPGNALVPVKGAHDEVLEQIKNKRSNK